MVFACTQVLALADSQDQRPAFGEFFYVVVAKQVQAAVAVTSGGAAERRAKRQEMI